MGEFNTAMSFLKVLGKSFCDAGQQDIVTEAGLEAVGSIIGVINGHHYNRSIQTIKVVFEALEQLQFQAYCHSLSPWRQGKKLRNGVNI